MLRVAEEGDSNSDEYEDLEEVMPSCMPFSNPSVIRNCLIGEYVQCVVLHRDFVDRLVADVVVLEKKPLRTTVS